jgi:hypothetical protein
LLLSKGLLAAIQQFGVRNIGLCGGNIRLRGCNIRLCLRNLLWTAPSQKARNHLLLSCHSRLALRHRIQKARLNQLGYELPGMNSTAFIYEQLVNSLTVVEGKLYLANVYVAIERDGIAGSLLPLHPVPDKETRDNKKNQSRHNGNSLFD